MTDKRGGAKHSMRSTKKKKRTKTFQFQKPIFKGKSATNENIIMAAANKFARPNLTIRSIKTMKKKKKSEMDPEEYLEKVKKFLDKLGANVSKMSKKKHETHEYVAFVLMQELDDVLKTIGAELHIDENEGDVFAYINALNDLIEDKLEDFDEIKNNVEKQEQKFMMRAEMYYLASSIDDAMNKAKMQYLEFIKKSPVAKSSSSSKSSKSGKSSKSSKSSKSAMNEEDDDMLGLVQGLKGTTVKTNTDDLLEMFEGLSMRH